MLAFFQDIKRIFNPLHWTLWAGLVLVAVCFFGVLEINFHGSKVSTTEYHIQRSELEGPRRNPLTGLRVKLEPYVYYTDLGDRVRSILIVGCVWGLLLCVVGLFLSRRWLGRHLSNVEIDYHCSLREWDWFASLINGRMHDRVQGPPLRAASTSKSKPERTDASLIEVIGPPAAHIGVIECKSEALQRPSLQDVAVDGGPARIQDASNWQADRRPRVVVPVGLLKKAGSN